MPSKEPTKKIETWELEEPEDRYIAISETRLANGQNICRIF